MEDFSLWRQFVPGSQSTTKLTTDDRHCRFGKLLEHQNCHEVTTQGMTSQAGLT